MKKKKIIKWLMLIIVLLIGLAAITVLSAIVSENGKVLLPVKHKTNFQIDNIDDFPGLLQVKSNQIISPSGESVLLRGLMPPDPAKLHDRNRFNKKFFEQIRDSGANIVRIPVHPENYYKDKDYLLRYLDPIVQWAGELGMYVIIDLHYIGNISDGTGKEMPDIDTHPKDFAIEFWRKTAAYFKEVPNVMFEIFNEPANISSKLWAENANELVGTIRAQGAEQIIIVGGIQYSKDLSWVKRRPINDDNIVYASHIYPAHNPLMWKNYFGDIADKYPVLITEWGFMDENRKSTNQHYLIGDEKTYGAPLINYLNEKGIGWVACWFDNRWEPQLFNEDFKSYTNFGEFVFDQLKTEK